MSNSKSHKASTGRLIHSKEKRVNRVSIYLDDGELEAIFQKLQLPRGVHPFTAGRSVAEHFRRAEKNQRPASLPAPEINRNAWVQLSRTTSNLNQLTHAVNVGRATGVELKTLIDLRIQVEHLRSALLGFS
jgi:hypothetical protein